MTLPFCVFAVWALDHDDQDSGEVQALSNAAAV